MRSNKGVPESIRAFGPLFCFSFFVLEKALIFKGNGVMLKYRDSMT